MAFDRKNESNREAPSGSSGDRGRMTSLRRPQAVQQLGSAKNVSSGQATVPLLNILKYGVIFAFIINMFFEEARWNSSSAPSSSPGTIGRKQGKWSSAGVLRELVDDDANERDWAEFAEKAPLRTISDRQRLHQEEEELAGNRTLDRIYYLNLPHRPLRREMMESWLRNQSTPFYRIEPIRGVSNVSNCASHKRQTERCYGLTSLARTLVGIIRQKDVRGLTLVLEDDYKVTVPLNELVQMSLEIVPSDWDIIRWDCSGGMGSLVNPKRVVTPSGTKATVVKTVLKDECYRLRETQMNSGTCWFCGGTHVHMWRGSSVDKLAKVWAEMPYNDVDCRLATPELSSYCINFDDKVGRFMHDVLPGELSDVTSIKRPGHLV